MTSYGLGVEGSIVSRMSEAPRSRSRATDPRGYLPDPGLDNAAEVALLLGRPLLLTGESGSGKTQFAFSLASRLELGAPLRFDCKSTSTFRDLLYTYDYLTRFHQAQMRERADAGINFVTLNALGVAITLTRAESPLRCRLPPELQSGPVRRSVILVDEIDKAPRDLPNDILNELEDMYFHIPELNVDTKADPKLMPVIVFTSNSEKHLPEPFLRRCIYYDIPPPDEALLRRIVASRVENIDILPSEALGQLFDFYKTLRASSTGLEKQPGTAELLDWIMLLLALKADGEDVLSRKVLRHSIAALLKTAVDHRRGGEILDKWQARRT